MNNGGERWWKVLVIYDWMVKMYSIFWADGKTQYESRYDTPFRGPIIPYGTEIFHHPVSTKDQNRLHQFSSSKVFSLDMLWTRAAAGQVTCSRQMQKKWRTTLLQKSTSEDWKKMKWEFRKRWRTILISMCLLLFFQKIAVNGPNHHATNPSPSYSNFLVEDISECLLEEEEEDGSDLAKEQKTIWKRNMSSGASLKVSFNDIMVWTYQDFSCLEKNLFLFRWITWTLFDTFTRFWTYYRSTQSTIFWSVDGDDHYLDPGLDSRDSQFSRHHHPTDICGHE